MDLLLVWLQRKKTLGFCVIFPGKISSAFYEEEGSFETIGVGIFGKGEYVTRRLVGC